MRYPDVYIGLTGLTVEWPGAELNCRHADFQSAALPTELPGPGPGIINPSQDAGYRLSSPANPLSLGTNRSSSGASGYRSRTVRITAWALAESFLAVR